MTVRIVSFLAAIFSLILCPVAAPAQPVTPAAAEYIDVVKALETFIEREVADKRLPALSIALVDGQRIVWARGFGFADPALRVPATADTVYRVGAVSQLFTAVAAMQLVEQGKLDLDKPVTEYLPTFKPKNPFGKPITLRQLMAHRSGLVREPPVGNRFDPEETTLAQTVASLDKTPLVYEPGTRQKFSNAGIAAVGLAVEMVSGKPFDQRIQENLVHPMEMKSTSFSATPAVTKNLAKSVMWTYHGTEFPGPTHNLGAAPAEGMYSTANDLARFLTVLFNDGKTANGALLKPESLKEMLTLQFTKDETTGFGLGFAITHFRLGGPRAGEGNSINGFAAELAFLPEDKLGVVLIATRDMANPVLTRIADFALGAVRLSKAGKPLPITQAYKLSALEPEVAPIFGGRYRSDGDIFDLIQSGSRLWHWPRQGSVLTEVRSLRGAAFLTESVHAFGPALLRTPRGFRVGGKNYLPVPDEGPYATIPPPEPPGHFVGLIGEYGWDQNVLFIFEKDGALHALINWLFVYPLAQESEDVYQFPKQSGLYHGEKLTFRRDQNGKATEVEAASVVFKRRILDGEGKTFRIEPQKPIAELRKEAQQATPPVEKGPFREPDLVEIASLDSSIKFDLRYATDNNFLSTPLYPASAKGYMQRPAAEAVVRVHKSLEKDGYGLLIHDPYRPWQVTKMFWDATPPRFRNFVADPSKGSRHNRGCAVDLTLFDRKTGKVVEMVGGYDEFSDRSYPDYIGGTSWQRWHRDLLRRRMEAEGFTVYEAEWWHFDYKDWRVYGILNKSFDELANKK